MKHSPYKQALLDAWDRSNTVDWTTPPPEVFRPTHFITVLFADGSKTRAPVMLDEQSGLAPTHRQWADTPRGQQPKAAWKREDDGRWTFRGQYGPEGAELITILNAEDGDCFCALPTATRKAWATFVIECWQAMPGKSPPVTDPEVMRLAQLEADATVGECDECGKRAPLKKEWMEPEWFRTVCAWGCT